MALFTSASVAAFLGVNATFMTAATATILNAVVGTAVNLLAQAVAGKPKGQGFAINGSLQGGGDVSRSFILGRTATAGSLVWANTWGRAGDADNAYLTQVIALSDLPVAGLDELWVNGEKVEINWNDHRYAWGFPVPQYLKNGDDNQLWIRFYDGRQADADPFLRTLASANGRVWGADRVGKGVAYAVITAQGNGNMFSGIPSFKFVLSGLRLYDISRDSSAGGNGPQRWDDPTSWGGDGDHLPAVQIYNLLRGLRYENEWFYGLQGVSGARLPADNWIAQINKCRASSGGKATYRAAGEINLDAPVSTAIEALLSACQGRISEIGGVYRIHVGEPDLPVAAFSDVDILSTQEQSFTPFFGLADTINGMTATYPSPEDGWTVKAAPPIYRTDLEVLHGNRRLMADVSLDFVPYAEQVQRLMKSALLEGQRARRHTLVLPPKFWPYAVPGAVLVWTSARNGYQAKQFRVDGAIDRANLDVMIDITEIDPSDYDWQSNIDFDPPVDGALGIIRPSPQLIIDWHAEPASVLDDAGEARRPGIQLSWDGDKLDVIGVEFEVRLASSLATIYQGRTDQPERGSLLISQGLLPNVRYGVRGRYIPGSDRPVLWSGWLDVVTPNVLISDISVYLDRLQPEIRNYLQARDQEFTDTLARLEFLAAHVGTATAEGLVQRQYLKKELGRNKASILRESSLRISENEALALDMTLIQASVDGNAAAILQEATTRATEDSAMAELLAVVSASAGGASANGLARWRAVAAPSGVLVRLSLEGRAEQNGAYKTGGMYLDITPDKAMALFNVDQFIISNGNVALSPFAYEGDTLRLANLKVRWADIADLIVENFKATNGNIGNAVIDSGNIASDAITNQNSAPGGAVGLTYNVETALMPACSIVSETGKPISISVKANLTNTGNTGQFDLKIKRDGVVIYDDDVRGQVEFSNWHSRNWFTILDTAPAGTYSYQVFATRRILAGAGSCSGSQIILQCNKR